MKRDRLETLVHLRELVERRRPAEQAAARRQLDAATHANHAARAALAGAGARPGTSLAPLALAAHRASGVALGDRVQLANVAERAADRDLGLAERRTITAAKERKAAERLSERRAEALAAEAEKQQQRRMDDLALTVWRRAR